jgi:hypothetical protein
MIANAVSAVHFFRCGSKGEILAASRCLPLYPRKRTQAGDGLIGSRL